MILHKKCMAFDDSNLEKIEKLAAILLTAKTNSRPHGLQPYACFDFLAHKFNPTNTSASADFRSIFKRDEDKIIHSNAYSRLRDKTQVFPWSLHDHITTRIKHVDMVASIAEDICLVLGLNHFLVRAIARGHDIGHNAYGHQGEIVLNKIIQKYTSGYLVHNAQSIRWLHYYEKNGAGLNLTFQTLDGILSHNGEDWKKYGERYYPLYRKTPEQMLEEYRNCYTQEKFDRTIRPATLEAAVMRISDIISYVGRDIHDAILLKPITVEDFFNKAPQATAVFALKKELQASQHKNPALAAHKLNSIIIGKLKEDLILHSFSKDYLTFSSEIFEGLNELLKFNYEYIYLNSKTTSHDKQFNIIFSYAFDQFSADLKKEKKESPIYKYFVNNLPEAYLKETDPSWIVIDFISGMTRTFLLEFIPEELKPALMKFDTF